MRILRFAIGLSASLISFSMTANAQTGASAEPEYVNQFYVLGGSGQLAPLEHEPMHHAIKRKNIPFIKANIEGRQNIDGGSASPVHIGPNAHFIVKMMTGQMDPTTLVHLKQLKVDKQGRYYVTGDSQAYVYTNGKSTGPQGDAAQLRINKYGQSSLEVQTTQPLAAGEYAFITNGMIADCFSVDPSLASSSSAAPVTPAKPQPAAWKLKPVEHPQAITDVYEATLAGTSEVGGERGAAHMDVSCTVNRFTGPAGTDASTSAILKVRREMVAFSTDALTCQGDGASGAPFLRSQLGTGQEQTRNLCFDEELGTDPRAVVSFGLSYEEPLLTSILRASGEPLTLKIRPQDGGPDAMTATFQLPANGSEVLAAFDPCLKVEEAKRKKEADAIVVACPELSDKHLTDVNVLIGTAMRKLPPDPENDIGVAWDMPKATKARPILPKLTLACSYQDGMTTAGGSAPSAKTVSAMTEKKLLPILVTAKFCVFREDPNTNAPYGNCSRE